MHEPEFSIVTPLVALMSQSFSLHYFVNLNISLFLRGIPQVEKILRAVH